MYAHIPYYDEKLQYGKLTLSTEIYKQVSMFFLMDDQIQIKYFEGKQSSMNINPKPTNISDFSKQCCIRYIFMQLLVTNLKLQKLSYLKSL